MITVYGYRNRAGEHIPDWPRRRKDPLGTAITFFAHELADGGKVVDRDSEHVTIVTRFGHCVDTTTFRGPAEEKDRLLSVLNEIDRLGRRNMLEARQNVLRLSKFDRERLTYLSHQDQVAAVELLEDGIPLSDILQHTSRCAMVNDILPTGEVPYCTCGLEPSKA